MGKEFILFQIIENILEAGLIINQKGKVLLLGLMEGNIMAIIKMIKKKDMAFLNGLMEKYIKGNGKMENKMVRENFILLVIIVGEKVFGKMEKK